MYLWTYSIVYLGTMHHSAFYCLLSARWQSKLIFYNELYKEKFLWQACWVMLSNCKTCGKFKIGTLPRQTPKTCRPHCIKRFSCCERLPRFAVWWDSSSLAAIPYCRQSLFTSAEIRCLYSTGRNARSAYLVLYKTTRCGKFAFKNGIKIFSEQGFKNKGMAATEQAFAAAAACTTLSNSLGESVMPGSTGAQFTLVLIPAAASFSTVLKRRSGRGARGSRMRARFVFVVVIVI